MQLPAGSTALLCFIVAAGIGATHVSQAGAVDLRVQGRTHIEMSVEAAGSRLVVQGRLVDDLGDPLRQRSITLEARRAGESVVENEQKVTTRRGGRFRTAFELRPGQYEIRAAFEDTEHLSGTRTEASVQLRAHTPEVTLRAPAWVVGDGAEATLRVGVTVDGVGLDVETSLYVRDRRRKTVMLDADGRARVPLDGLLDPGDNRIRVVVPSSSHRPGAAGTTSVRYSDTAEVSAQSELGFAQFERVIRLRGRLTDATGGISDADIRCRVFQKGQTESPVLERTLKSGSGGHFEAEFDTATLKDGKYHAVASAIPSAGETLSSDAGSVTLDRSLTRWIVDGAAGLAVFVVLVLLGWRGWRAWSLYRQRRKMDQKRRQRQEHAFETQEVLEPIQVDEEIDGPEPEETRDPRRIRAQLWDEWRDQPVTGGTVVFEPESEDDEEGTRRENSDEKGRVTVTLPEGQWHLTVEATGMMPAENRVSIPHDGSYDGARFELVAIPLKIRRLFESISAMLSEEDLWGTMTPREIEETLRQVVSSAGATEDESDPDEPLEANVSRRFESLIAGNEQLESPEDYLRALTDLLEEAYYSPRTYGRDVWEFAREIGTELRQRATGGTAGGQP